MFKRKRKEDDREDIIFALKRHIGYKIYPTIPVFIPWCGGERYKIFKWETARDKEGNEYYGIGGYFIVGEKIKPIDHLRD